MNKVIILGSNGFTGSFLAARLQSTSLSSQYRLIGIDVAGSPPPGVEFIQADVADSEVLEATLTAEKPDYIINLVGSFTSPSFVELLRFNAGISQSICEILVRKNIVIKKLLLIGSAAEYGACDALPVKEKAELRPVTLYGLSKAVQTQCAEYYFRNHGLPINVARTFNIIGKGLSCALSIGSFAVQLQSCQDGDEMKVGNLSTKRDFLDVRDVVDAYWKILVGGSPGEIYNVCRGSSTPVVKILNELIRLSGKDIKISVCDELLKSKDIEDIYGDNSKLIHDTGWQQFIDINKSISLML